MRAELQELMAADPADFVATRTRLVRGGARELARVRKPALRLWAANRALTARRDAAGRLAEATLRLRQLEARIAGGERGAGADLRQALAAQKRELDTLESEAAQHAPGAAAEAREIIRRAVVGGGEVWADLCAGLLFREPAPPADAVFALAAGSLPRPDRERAAEDAERRRRQEEARRLRAEADRLEREAGELEAQARRARGLAEAAAARAAEAEGRA